MQNKPNFPNAQILVNGVLTVDYVNIRLRSRRQNKANSKPIQSQFKANQTQFKPKYAENKPNSKPIQTQFQTSPAQRIHFLKPKTLSSIASAKMKQNFKISSDG